MNSIAPTVFGPGQERTSRSWVAPTSSPELLAWYEQQFCTYAHILEHRFGKQVDRLDLYWTSEPTWAAALMEFPYRPEQVEEAGRRFDEVVGRIETDDFRVVIPPEAGICKECDLQAVCHSDGTISSARGNE